MHRDKVWNGCIPILVHLMEQQIFGLVFVYIVYERVIVLGITKASFAYIIIRFYSKVLIEKANYFKK